MRTTTAEIPSNRVLLNKKDQQMLIVSCGPGAKSALQVLYCVCINLVYFVFIVQPYNDYETVCLGHMLEALCPRVLLKTCFYCNLDFKQLGFQLHIFIHFSSTIYCLIAYLMSRSAISTSASNDWSSLTTRPPLMRIRLGDVIFTCN